MIKSAVTVSLVKEAEGGPFIFWHDLRAACQKASELGFDAIELFAASPESIDPQALRDLLDEFDLGLAAVGTGAGKIVRGLTLTDPNPDRRAEAKHFVKMMIDLGGHFAAPAIIGSMQGRWNADVDKEQALDWLAEGLAEVGHHAQQFHVPVLYEPLNHYETNLINKISDGMYFLEQGGIANVKLLADLFHMNIEEDDIARGLRKCGQHIGHVHFADSNRKPIGNGHIDIVKVADALREIAYDRYLSAEAFPWPNPEDAARQTMESFNRFFR